MQNMPTGNPSAGSVVNKQLDTPNNSLGVNIHTRPMGVHSQRLGAISAFGGDVIREPGWDMQKWVERPQVLSSTQWTSAQASHTVLASYNIPTDLLITPFLRSPFNSFLYWRGDIEVHLQTSGTPFHMGTLMMFYVPNAAKSSSISQACRNNFSSATNLQHTILHANASTSACMTIPFINQNTYLNIGNSIFEYANTGSLHVVVFNPLVAASGASNSINVSVVVQFKNSEFKIPRSAFSPTFVAEGLIENLLGKSGGKIIQGMLPRNIIADVVDTALGIFGLDKPTSIERGAPMKMIGTQYMNSSIEIDYLDKLTMFPSKLQETDAHIFGVNNNEMEFSYLKTKQTYVGSFTQDIGDLPGSLLASLPLCPIVVPLKTTSSTIAPFVRYINKVPLLQYLTLPFSYWKGGLTYKIQVVATSFHNTKIIASVNYGSFNTLTDTTVPQAASQYAFAFEVNQGATEFEFTVPFVAPRHQLAVPGEDNSIYDAYTSMGTLGIYVLNELAVSNNVPVSISYNVFIAGAADFSVNTISAVGTSYAPANPSNVLFVAESILSTPFTDAELAEPTVVISPSTSVALRNDVNEQSISSIIQPLKKYNLVARQTFNSVESDYSIFRLASLFGFPSSGAVANYLDPTTNTFISYFAQMYRGFRGPLRFKFALNTVPTATSFKIIYIPPSASDVVPAIDYANLYESYAIVDSSVASVTINRPRLQMAVVNAVQKTAEFEIPYTPAFNYSLISPIAPPASFPNAYEFGSFMFISDNGHTPTTVDAEFDIYCAFGDEAKFGILAQVPGVEISIDPATGLPNYASGWNTTPSPIFSLTIL